MKNPKSPINTIKIPNFEIKKNNKIENYIPDKEILSITNNVRKNVENIVPNIENKLSNKIKEKFSELPSEFQNLAKITFGDLEHSNGGNRLFLKSKIIDAIKEGKKFSYASYDVNGMGISNKFDKKLGNLRILELSHISHAAIDFLKENGYKESFFSRNGGDEFSMFSTAPDIILKEAIEYGKTKNIGHINDVINKDSYVKMKTETANTKGGSSEEEILEKMTGFTVGINTYDYEGKKTKTEDLEDEYKKIVISTDEDMEHTKNGTSDKILENGIVLGNISAGKEISGKEKAKSLDDFKQKNELSENQNKNFETIGQKLDINIKNNFYKITKKRNSVLKKLKLKDFEIEELDYKLGKASFTKEDIKGIQAITGIDKKEIIELKIEYIQALFARGHYTGGYQSQVQNVITTTPGSGFSIENKIVVNTPSFKSVNEISGHTNGDYFLMDNFHYLKNQMQKIFEEVGIKHFGRNVIMVSKGPNTEIFIKDNLARKYPKNIFKLKNNEKDLEKNLKKNLENGNLEIEAKKQIDIIDKFKNRIKSSNYLEDFNKRIGEDENGKNFLEKRIDFIKEKQKNKIFDKTKELILIKLGKKLQSNEIEELKLLKTRDEIFSFYKEIEMKKISERIIKKGSKIDLKKLNKAFENKIKKIDKKSEELIKKEIGQFEILK